MFACPETGGDLDLAATEERDGHGYAGRSCLARKRQMLSHREMHSALRAALQFRQQFQLPMESLSTDATGQLQRNHDHGRQVLESAGLEADRPRRQPRSLTWLRCGPLRRERPRHSRESRCTKFFVGSNLMPWESLVALVKSGRILRKYLPFALQARAARFFLLIRRAAAYIPCACFVRGASCALETRRQPSGRRLSHEFDHDAPTGKLVPPDCDAHPPGQPVRFCRVMGAVAADRILGTARDANDRQGTGPAHTCGQLFGGAASPEGIARGLGDSGYVRLARACIRPAVNRTSLDLSFQL
jgi:hypothetical protein